MTTDLTPPEWVNQAECGPQKGAYDPDLWHPSHKPGTRINRSTTAFAKAVCNLHCPVQTQCLNWAITTNQEDGIYGAMTPGERRKLTAQGNTP